MLREKSPKPVSYFWFIGQISLATSTAFVCVCFFLDNQLRTLPTLPLIVPSFKMLMYLLKEWMSVPFMNRIKTHSRLECKKVYSVDSKVASKWTINTTLWMHMLKEPNVCDSGMKSCDFVVHVKARCENLSDHVTGSGDTVKSQSMVSKMWPEHPALDLNWHLRTIRLLFICHCKTN